MSAFSCHSGFPLNFISSIYLFTICFLYMLVKIPDKNITSQTMDYIIPGDIKLHTEILRGQGSIARRALFIHGGGVTGNHSIVRRPAMWLIDKGSFDEIILPDRRGAGESSPFTRLMTTGELATDMRLLLDEMKIGEPLTVIASSYGGPIALMLASIDKRIEKVILLASSPVLTLTKGVLKVPHEMGLLLPPVKFIIRFFTGQARYNGYVDLDFIYDITSVTGYIRAQIDILRKMKKGGISSMLLQAESVFLEENMSLSSKVSVDVPVVQVIGERDRVWEKNISAKYLKSMPLFHQVIIKDASHKDIFMRADEFLAAALKDEDPED